MAKETCNTLNNQGDHFEHNDGHGQHNLSVGFAMLLLACLVDQTQPGGGALCQAVGGKLGRTRLLWERMSALCYDDALDSMQPLLAARFDGLKKPQPIVVVDASSSRPRCPCPRCSCAPTPSNPATLHRVGTATPQRRDESIFNRDSHSCLIANVPSKDGNR